MRTPARNFETCTLPPRNLRQNFARTQNLRFAPEFKFRPKRLLGVEHGKVGYYGDFAEAEKIPGFRFQFFIFFLLLFSSHLLEEYNFLLRIFVDKLLKLFRAFKVVSFDLLLFFDQHVGLKVIFLVFFTQNQWCATSASWRCWSSKCPAGPSCSPGWSARPSTTPPPSATSDWVYIAQSNSQR